MRILHESWGKLIESWDRLIEALSMPGFILTQGVKRLCKVDVHERRGGEIVRGWGKRPEERMDVGTIGTWQIFMEMGFDIVVIELADGRCLEWFDTSNDLIHILRDVAADRERPWRHA